MTEKLFETALGLGAPWYVADADFNAPARTLTIRVDFKAGSRFAVPGLDGEHPVHDTVSKRYRHLNFFQHECFLDVRVPRVRLPDGAVRQIEPPWAGKLSGFTLLFEALVLMLCQQMTFAGAARLVGESRHRVVAHRQQEPPAPHLRRDRARGDLLRGPRFGRRGESRGYRKPPW